MKPIVRRIAKNKVLWIAAALVGVYALIGFLLVPYWIERTMPRYAEENLGVRATLGKVRVNPFLFKLQADDFELTAPSGPALAGFKHLLVDVEAASLLHWAWTLGAVEIDGLHVNVEIGRDGRFNLADLAERWSKGHPPSPDQKPLRTIVQHLVLRGATLSFTDRSQPKPAFARSDAINLEVRDLATLPDREGQYAISASLPGGGALTWQGEVSLQPLASKGEMSIKGLRLATVWQFFRDEMRLAEPRGTLAIAGHYDFSYANGAAALAMQGMHATVSALSLRHEGEEQPMLALDVIEAADARYDGTKRELIVPKLRFAKGTFGATVAADGTLDWQSLFKPGSPPKDKPAAAAPFHAHADAIAIDSVRLHYTDRTRKAPLQYAAAGNANLTLDITTGGATRVAADNMRIALADASLSAGKDELVNLKSIALEGGRLDSQGRRVTAATLAVKGGSAAIARDGDGRIALIDAFALARASPEPAAPREKERASAPWRYAVQSADLSGVTVMFAERSYKPAVRYDVEIASVALKNIAGDAKSPIDMRADLRLAQGGTLRGSGTIAQDFTRADVKVDGSNLDVRPLQPVLARYTILDLKSGNVSATARVAYSSGGKPALRVEGSTRIRNLLVNEADTGDRFLSWRGLAADSIALTVSPNRLLVKEVRIAEPGAKIVVAKDRSVNLTQILKPRGDSAAPAKGPQDAGDRFPVRVTRVSLQRGTLDFADNSLLLPFATRVTALSGAIVGLSSAPQSRADLKLEGLIEPNGSANAAGSLKPNDPKSFLDINVKFDNVEMPPLSPYTATFAGRKIAAGRLWLDVEYKIVESQLLGENKIAMSDFQLGERVEAPNALDLPLDLAVALLKEPDGRINLAVPVRGDVDNPKFDYRALIRDAIANTLKRIVTAPFRFIAGLFGGRGEEDLQSVQFEPGSARVVPAQREQLQKVAQALKERRQLKLVVHGAYNPQRDARALRDAAVRAALARELGVKMKAGQDAGPVALDDPDTQRALEKLFVARAGDDGLQKFANDYAKRTGKEPRRVNPLLAVFNRGRGDREFYEALFERLVDLEPLPDAALADLAGQRARAIADIVAQAGVDPARVQAGKTQAVEGDSKPVAARLELEAASG